jgi:hypothetical protein
VGARLHQSWRCDINTQMLENKNALAGQKCAHQGYFFTQPQMARLRKSGDARQL